MRDMCFSVDHIADDGLVIGRNGYVDIPVGSVFNVLAKEKLVGDLPDLRSVDLGVVAEVRLLLTEVWCYRRSVDVIPGGHSAGLRLEGAGIDSLKRSLQTQQSREALWLRVQEAR